MLVDPWRPVTVTQNDRDHPGYLLSWQRSQAGWRALVRYQRGVGLQYEHWVGAGEVRPR